MLYDLGTQPRRGSLLESVFLLIANRRQYQEFLETRVSMEASLAPHIEGGLERLNEAYEAYAKQMLPYLGKVRNEGETEEQAALKKWTDRGPLAVRPLWQAKEAASGWKSALQRGRERVLASEEARRRGMLRRI